LSSAGKQRHDAVSAWPLAGKNEVFFPLPRKKNKPVQPALSTARSPGVPPAAGYAITDLLRARHRGERRMPLATFGHGKNGALGHGTLESCATPTPLRDVTGAPSLLAAALGGAHSAALSARGEVFCWGEADRCAVDAAARLGCVPAVLRRPTRVTALRGRPVTRIGAGAMYTLAATAEQELWVWGAPANGGGSALPVAISNPPRMPTCLWRAQHPVQALR
jgi:hypothetical protein